MSIISCADPFVGLLPLGAAVYGLVEGVDTGDAVALKDLVQVDLLRTPQDDLIAQLPQKTYRNTQITLQDIITQKTSQKGCSFLNLSLAEKKLT